MTTPKPIRWGLLATGDITRKLLAGAALSPEVEVTAAGSRSAERAQQFAAANGIPRAHGSYQALLADPEVDAVYISLPNSLHHEWTMKALAAGKHVLCEKPYTRTPAEVDEAFDAAEAAGLVFEEAFMWRHTPQVRKLLELLPSLGPVRAVRATFSYAMDAGYDVRIDSSLDGGSLMDVGCYCVSGARLILGEPVRVSGEQVIGQHGVDSRFAGLMRFSEDRLASFVSGFDTTSESLEILGADARLYLPDPWHSVTGVLYRDDEEIRVEPINPYQLELEDVNAAIRGERAPLLGRADALGQARAIEALYRAAGTGTVVTL
ncbi:MAG: Gfo/Idh/MocA family oxidoreductase [Propionicimonas sp.]|uniref:Gfo/Idh/MocA family protein n=1 Tax=Propionicimonas sp. TaxID=1955623 RepID=UPI002B21D19A|nr:Gfo/Idh/MocA family oxidoreductase [Propionicimonas sp.]MEA4945714.1 Gfo/Idh/MocA family oxidoreductase [Propionicimonas sp.]